MGIPLNLDMDGEMEMISGFSNSFPWPSLESASVQTHLPFLVSTPLLSLQIMLGHFGDGTSGTGSWSQCMAVSFLPFVIFFYFLSLFFPFCFICTDVGFSVGLISLGGGMECMFPQQCLQHNNVCFLMFPLMPTVVHPPHILLCPLPTVAIALFWLGLRGCGVGARWLDSIHCHTDCNH